MNVKEEVEEQFFRRVICLLPSSSGVYNTALNYFGREKNKGRDAMESEEEALQTKDEVYVTKK